jgi:excisionase family DNA binding protein
MWRIKALTAFGDWPMQSPTYGSKRAAAAEAGVSRSTIERLIASGAIEARKLGSRRVMVDLRTLRRHLDSLPRVSLAHR